MTSPARVRSRLRVVIADDRPRTRGALRAFVGAHPGFAVVGDASNGNEALERVEQLRPDIVVLDLRMDGIAATALIKTQWPPVRVIVHSLAVERRDEAMAAGADAFVLKGGRPDELIDALERVTSQDLVCAAMEAGASHTHSCIGRPKHVELHTCRRPHQFPA